MYKSTSRGQRLLNLVLKSECAVENENIAPKIRAVPQSDVLEIIHVSHDENNDFASKNPPSQRIDCSLIQPEDLGFDISATKCVKSFIPEPDDDTLITPEDLGYVNDRLMSSSPSLLLPLPAAVTAELKNSDDDDDIPLLISTEAIIHATLHGSNAASHGIEYQDETKSPPGRPSPPDVDLIQPFGSDDSVEDLHGAPSSKKRRLIPLSDSEDDAPLSSLRPHNSNLLENIPLPSDDEIEHQVRTTNYFKKTENRRLVNKKARVLGETYLGFAKVHNKYEQCVEKPERIKKARCSHTKVTSTSKNSYMCALISEEERTVIHSYFWNLQTWSEKKAFVKAAAVRRGIRRRRRPSSVTTSKKSGHDIFFNKSDEKSTKVRVCRMFFLNTLAIGEDTFRRWTKESDMVVEDDDVNLLHSSRRRDTVITSSTSHSVLQYTTPITKTVKSWIDLVPKVPSHYCRASSNKLYVESTFRSQKHMHEVFVEWCKERESRAASRPTFLKVLDQENIAIHHPRKDQCDTCCSFKAGNISQQEYDDHILKKNEARQAKKDAISLANDKVVVITVDVQSVLLAPKLLASALYYKLKLQCHNFTVYDCRTKKVTIYFWHEADGGVSANEFTTCLIDYLTNLAPETERVIVISDGCGHQNRNRILSSALSDLSQRSNMNIEQLYLEKGHTMMEVDSVHSTIEQYIKPPIYAPSDYVSRMQQARPRNPYDVKSIHYDFFNNYEVLQSNFKSIRPGKKKGDPVVVDIRGLKYLPDGSVLYKLQHNDEWSILPQRRATLCRRLLPQRLFLHPPKITESKFKHLKELKVVIDKDYHPFYDAISFNPGT